jgi:heme-degrading monooxygenase HmoA
MSDPLFTTRIGPDGTGGEVLPAATSVGFVVLYRWRVRADMEAEFAAAWARITSRLKAERGSLGARLHRGSDGIWYSYAQWPSAEIRAAAFSQGPLDEDAEAVMKDAILEHLPETLLAPVADLLMPV